MGSLSEAQRSIIVGSLLGDGSMRCKTNALLEINHSWIQRRYVDWKYSQLADLVATPPRQRPGNGGRIAYRFTTRSLPALTPFFEAVYASGAKHVPELVLTPLALAIWFMDDGCRSRSAVYLNTQQFSIRCQERLLHLLETQWAIRGTLNLSRYLLPMFEYKLPQVTP